MVINLAGLVPSARAAAGWLAGHLRRAAPPTGRVLARPDTQEVAGAALVCLAVACWQPIVALALAGLLLVLHANTRA